MNLVIKERHSDMGLVDKLFGSYSAKELKRIRPQVEAVLGLEEHYRAMDNRTLQGETARLKGLLAQGKTLEDILPEAFAACREAADRVLGMRHFPVQVMGGIILHQGRIAEMKTGEGKTLVALTHWAARACTSSPSTNTWPAATASGWATCTAGWA